MDVAEVAVLEYPQPLRPDEDLTTRMRAICTGMENLMCHILEYRHLYHQGALSYAHARASIHLPNRAAAHDAMAQYFHPTFISGHRQRLVQLLQALHLQLCDPAALHREQRAYHVIGQTAAADANNNKCTCTTTIQTITRQLERHILLGDKMGETRWPRTNMAAESANWGCASHELTVHSAQGEPDRRRVQTQPVHGVYIVANPWDNAGIADFSDLYLSGGQPAPNMNGVLGDGLFVVHFSLNADQKDFFAFSLSLSLCLSAYVCMCVVCMCVCVCVFCVATITVVQNGTDVNTVELTTLAFDNRGATPLDATTLMTRFDYYLAAPETWSLLENGYHAVRIAHQTDLVDESDINDHWHNNLLDGLAYLRSGLINANPVWIQWAKHHASDLMVQRPPTRANSTTAVLKKKWLTIVGFNDVAESLPSEQSPSALPQSVASMFPTLDSL